MGRCGIPQRQTGQDLRKIFLAACVEGGMEEMRLRMGVSSGTCNRALCVGDCCGPEGRVEGPHSTVEPEALGDALANGSIDHVLRWLGCGETGALTHCWWHCELGQPQWGQFDDFKMHMDFPGGAVVKNLPANAGENAFEPWSGKIPHAAEQLSLCTTTTEPACHNY